MASVIDHMAEQMESLQLMFTQSDVSRTQVDERMVDLVGAVEKLTAKLDQSDSNAALLRAAEGQEALIGKLADSGLEGIDAESRMRLRSIDVQLLRILEEMAAGRQEVLADLRTDIAALTRALRQSQNRARKGDGGQG